MKTATLALVAMLALAPQTSAKPWVKIVEVCGASACTRVTGERASRIAELAKTDRGWGEPLWRQMPRPAPFYRVIVDRNTRWAWTFLYVPTAPALRIEDPNDASLPFWRTAAPVLRAALAGPARGLRTVPAPARWPR